MLTRAGPTGLATAGEEKKKCEQAAQISLHTPEKIKDSGAAFRKESPGGAREEAEPTPLPVGWRNATLCLFLPNHGGV